MPPKLLMPQEDTILGQTTRRHCNATSWMHTQTKTTLAEDQEILVNLCLRWIQDLVLICVLFVLI